MKPHVVKLARKEFAKWYGVNLTEAQVEAILAQDAELLKEFERYRATATSFDTFDREALPDLLCRYFKIEKRWPINGDRDEYVEAFFHELALCCAAHGIETANDT